MSSKERFILKEIKKWYKDSLISEEQLKELHIMVIDEEEK